MSQQRGRVDPVRLAIAIVCVTSTLVPASDRTDARIPIFLRVAASADGFTDPSKDRQDTARDVLGKLLTSKVVRYVRLEEDALVVIEVLGRQTRDAMSWVGASTKKSVTVRLTAGEYSNDFTADSWNGYGSAAGSVVKQLETWVKTNRARILALQSDGR
jgi:hypothetical protein